MRTKICISVAVLLIFQGEYLSAQEPSKWLEQVRPELEKALGYSLEKLPLIQFASIVRQADPDVDACVRWRWPHLQDDALARALVDAQAVMASATVARLVEGTNVILIGPQNQNNIAGWDSTLNGAVLPGFSKLALIHETVRYVLDSRYDLAKRRAACQDAEEWFALHALIEGRAQWVTRQLARKLGMEEIMPLLTERFLHVPDQDRDPALRTISQSVIQKRHWADQQGLAFFDYLESQGLGDVEKLVFDKPPKLTKWIEEPALYVRALKSQRPDLATILTKLAQVPPPATPGWSWSSMQQAWTSEMMSEVAGIFGKSELTQKLVDSWKEGRSLVWTISWSEKGQVQCPQRVPVAITLTRLQTPDAARTYHAFALELQRRRLGNEEFKESNCKLAGIEEARTLERKTPFPAKISQTCTLLARWADTVVEISWYEQRPDQAWTEQIIASLLAADL